MLPAAIAHKNLPSLPRGRGLKIEYLSEAEINALTQAWQAWYDSSKQNGAQRRIRGRYWLTYLTLRYTGARLGEVIQINDVSDINLRAAELHVTTLKRRRGAPKRIIPVPPLLIAEISMFLAEFPDQRGRVFTLDQGNFRRQLYAIAAMAGLLREYVEDGAKKKFPHPHTMRHTRAIELLRSGVPITGVQDLLGHSSVTTTAEYLRLSGADLKAIMQAKGLI